MQREEQPNRRASAGGIAFAGSCRASSDAHRRGHHEGRWIARASWIWAPTTFDDWKRHPYATGVVVALDTNFKGLFRLHAGGEAIGPFVGIESGPSLVRDDAGRWRLGLGSTVWAGFDVIPYYSYTLVFGGERNLHEVGPYLKLVMDPDFETKNSHGDWDD